MLSFKKNSTKWWSWSVEGLLSTGPTPSSFYYYYYNFIQFGVGAVICTCQEIQCLPYAGFLSLLTKY